MSKQLNNMFKSMQAIQSQLQQTQEELEKIQVTGEAGGGMVKITMNCKHRIVKVEIDPSLLEEKEIDMLQDLTMAAFNVALAKAENTANEKMRNFAGGMPALGGLSSLF